MGLDTRMNASLWKDRAAIELTSAVIHSFQVITKFRLTLISSFFSDFLCSFSLKTESECDCGGPPHGSRIFHDVSNRINGLNSQFNDVIELF